MSYNWNEVLSRQYAASIEALRKTLEACPDELWDDRVEGTPVWHIAYHVLFYCDFYLSDDEKSFRPRDYHKDHVHFLPGEYGEYGGTVTTPEDCYSKQQMLEYADFCLEKCKTVFRNLTDARAAERCGFWWYPFDVGEFLVNSLRHTQHHAAQIGLILRRRADIGVPWTRSEGKETPPIE